MVSLAGSRSPGPPWAETERGIGTAHRPKSLMYMYEGLRRTSAVTLTRGSACLDRPHKLLSIFFPVLRRGGRKKKYKRLLKEYFSVISIREEIINYNLEK